ncbi:MAG: 50S ribosomal protein L32 [candidate division Zixibacteria bacterium]|nr:50S ribosomal protein L32 [candidate division Zixibacteria bacterium]
MAVPKRRHSRARSRKRRTHWKLQAPAVTDCSNCQQPKLAHHICPNCGHYKGEEVIEAK